MRRLEHRASELEQFGSDGSVRGSAGRREGTMLGPHVLDDAAKAVLAGNFGKIEFYLRLLLVDLFIKNQLTNSAPGKNVHSL